MQTWKKWMKPAGAVMLSATLLAPTLAGCTKKAPSDDKTEHTLRIATTMGGPQDEWFRQQFTELFEFANPNIKIEIVPAVDYNQFRYQQSDKPEKMPDPIEKMKELMNGTNPPDLVMVNYDDMPSLVSENLLQPLDPRIQKDKFDLEGIVPAVIEAFKKLSPDNKLYALAPTFGSSALVYNKKMFDDAGVTYPTDNMKWDEIFDLARRLSATKGDKQQYGFSFNNYEGANGLWETNVYTQPMQLTMFDDKAEKMTVDSDSWEKVWKTVLDLRTQKVIPTPEDPMQMKQRAASGPQEYNPFQGDLFLSGRAAMTIIDYGYINQIIEANKNAVNVKGFTPVDWDVVTVPQHPEYPGVGGYMYMNGIMGINAKAQNPDDAWKFLKFMNGDDWARTKAKSSYQLVARKKYVQPKEGLSYNVNAFTQLTPVLRQNAVDNKLYRDFPNLGMVQSIGDQKYRDVMQGKIGVREALKQWQTEGDAMLKQIHENPNGPIQTPMGKEASSTTKG